MLETRFVLLGYRSVNPGTESIMNPKAVWRQMKNARIVLVSSGFWGFIFQ
jgi:hypothetical protein